MSPPSRIPAYLVGGIYVALSLVMAWHAFRLLNLNVPMITPATGAPTPAELRLPSGGMLVAAAIGVCWRGVRFILRPPGPYDSI